MPREETLAVTGSRGANGFRISRALVWNLTPRNDVEGFGLSEEDILRDVQLRNKTRLLADQTNAKSQRVPWVFDGDFAAARELDRARIGWLHSEEDFHQRRLASSVLAHQGVDFPGPHIKIHAL